MGDESYSFDVFFSIILASLTLWIVQNVPKKKLFDYVLLQRYLYVLYSFILLKMFKHFVACLLLFDI